MNSYSVLIPCIRTDSGDALLLEVRSQNVRQPGEICFPGGRIEKGELPGETAVRETCEELGLKAEDIDIIADPQIEIMGDGRKVWSVRARIDSNALPRLNLSEDEVAEVFLLPVNWLKDNPPVHYDLSTTPDGMLPDKLTNYLSNYKEFRHTGETYYWEYEDHGIWGLTAKILMRYRLQCEL